MFAPTQWSTNMCERRLRRRVVDAPRYASRGDVTPTCRGGDIVVVVFVAPHIFVPSTPPLLREPAAFPE
jgi:hypothetical protein